jgi:Ser/Thr protein kinase RdoA (MazF antagonist)
MSGVKNVTLLRDERLRNVPYRVVRSDLQSEMAAEESELSRQLAGRYDLRDVALRHLGTPVNDVVAVTSDEGEFALKLYHRNRRSEVVHWEVDLITHLRRGGAPVVQPVLSRGGGYLEHLIVGGQQRLGVLFIWASGSKPAPGYETYGLLGEAAARIHRAAEGFPAASVGERYDSAVLVDEQLLRMRHLLVQAGRWRAALALGERLKGRLSDPILDWGICHMDLTLDNVHLGHELTVFDFDSAGTCWRAVEPWGVLRFSSTFFRAWIAGYREVRPFGAADEAAVAAFGIVADLRVVAWKLGVAASSRGAPSLGVRDLPAVVDGWLDWEAAHLSAS